MQGYGLYEINYSGSGVTQILYCVSENFPPCRAFVSETEAGQGEGTEVGRCGKD